MNINEAIPYPNLNGHLYSETTCIKRPLCDVPKVSAPYILTCIQRPPLYKGHYEGALAWPFNTGFTVLADFSKGGCRVSVLVRGVHVQRTPFMQRSINHGCKDVLDKVE